MLNVPTPFPHVGSTAYLDVEDHVLGRDVVEQVRILSAPDGNGDVLIAIRSRRFPREIASGNRTVPLALLRETEQPVSKPSGRKPKASRSTGAKARENRR